MDIDFDSVVTIENLYRAWINFSAGKRQKTDVIAFAANVEDELCLLLDELSCGTYQHGAYNHFVVHDPKHRVIHKATVRDRVVHRLLYNALLPEFHKRWLACSYSCRPGFGQHRSLRDVRKGLGQATNNWSRECWVMKGDVRKFFDSICHKTLRDLLDSRLVDHRVCSLLGAVVQSFCVSDGVGLPIGNLTSQLFANVYMHELDWYAKQTLGLRWYYRYADDVLVLHSDHAVLESVLESIQSFLACDLQLTLHPKKITVRKSTWGIDWLGRVILPGHELLRPSTRRRMLRRINLQNVTSYQGLLIDTARKESDTRLGQSLALMRESDTMETNSLWIRSC